PARRLTTSLAMAAALVASLPARIAAATIGAGPSHIDVNACGCNNDDATAADCCNEFGESNAAPMINARASCSFGKATAFMALMTALQSALVRPESNAAPRTTSPPCNDDNDDNDDAACCAGCNDNCAARAKSALTFGAD